MTSTLLVALGLLGVGDASSTPPELLVGALDKDRVQIARALGKAGTLAARDEDGFYRVTLAKGETEASARKKLKVAGFTVVFPAAAKFLKVDSLPSVRQHVGYLKARAKLSGYNGEGESGVDFYEALEYYLESRVGPDGLIDKEAIERAVAHRDQMPSAFVQQMPQGGNTPSGSATWSYQGPKSLDIPYNQYYGVQPLAGRVNGIAYAPSSTDIIYLATAGGGVWKTTDGGANWSFMSGSTSTWKYLHTTCVDVHPTDPNIVLVGTGDYYGFFANQTDGIKRSTNGGTTWTTVGAAQFGGNIVTRIVFHPTNPNHVIALTAGASGDIWKSTDAGVTWSATNAPAGNWDDIDYGPVSGGVRQFYAVGGNGEAGGRIYRSTDQGSSWSLMPDCTASTQSIMDVACSKTTFGKLYVLTPNGNTMWRSTNSAATWTNLSLNTDPGFPNALGANASYNWSQDTYDLYVETSNFAGVEYVFVGLITMAVSTDSGNNWTDLSDSYTGTSYMHNDQHCLEPNPVNGTIILAGGDGGVFRWTDLPAPLGWSYGSLNSTLYNTQFYAMAVHPTSYSTYVMGGTQDNASPASRGNMADWDNLYAGDGGWCAFTPNSPGVHYSTAQNGAVYKYTSSLDTTPTGISPNWASSKFIAPLVIAQNSANLLMGANQTVNKYTGVGTGWTGGTAFGSQTRTLAVGISNTSRVYAGCDNGGVWRSDGGGIAFVAIDTTLPNTPIGAIACRWDNSTEVLVGLQGSSGGLYRCTNTAAATPSWTSVSGSGSTALPASPVNAVMWDPHNPGTWYVGTDVGAFMTTNYGVSWANMNSLGMGNVHVNMFAIPPDKTYLYAATFGRGIWRIPIKSVTFTAFTIPLTSIFGDRSMSATVTLSDPAPPAAVVKILDSSSYVTTPSEMTIPKGWTSANFTILTSQVFGASVNATVYATCMGTLRTVTFTIKPYPTVTSLVLSPSKLKGGLSFNATATLSFAAPFSGTVSFTDTSTAVNSPGATSIAAGATSKTVTISTNPVLANTSATVTATYKGWARVATVTVTP